MENKRYLDKVIDHLVRSTKIDYVNNLISPPFSSSFKFFVTYFSLPYSAFFSSYCENTFGLTNDEIEYVWEEYRSIIKDKINNG